MVLQMAEDTPPKDIPAAKAPPRPPERAIVIDPRVLIAGGIAAAIGLALVAMFMWMVPSAAAREAQSACRGLKGFQPLNPALCPDGKPCNLPVPAPDFEAVDHQGKPVKLSDFQGRVVLLNFWASWCGVCKTEKPSLVRMTEDLQGDDFVVVTLASDKNWANVLAASIASLNKNAHLPAPDEDGNYKLEEILPVYNKALPDGVPYKVLLDPPQGDSNMGPITLSWGLKAVPESALIDRKGNIRAYFVNKREWDSSVAQTCLRSVIDEE